MKPATFKGDAAARDCVTALREARIRIAGGWSNSLCGALYGVLLSAFANTPRVANAALEVRQWISACMGEHHYRPVEIWLKARGVDWAELTPERMRAYRLAWIDQMIRDFGGKP